MKEVALIGKGYWGAKMFESIYNNPNFKLKYHIGNDPRKDMLEDKEVESVFIATPMKTHYGIAKECMLAGKHVYSAKPLAMEYWQMLQLIDIAKTKGLHISVDYTTTFSIHLEKLKKDLEPLGEIIYMRILNGNWGRFNEYDAYWLYASHALAMLSLFKDLSTLNFTFDGEGDVGKISFDGGTILVSRVIERRAFEIFFWCNNGHMTYRPPGISNPSDLDMSVQHFHNVLTGKEKSNIEMAREITKIISTRGVEI